MKFKAVKLMAFATSLSLVGVAQASQEIGVAVVVDEGLRQSLGREWVDMHIAHAMALSNRALQIAGLDYQRVDRMVYESESGNDVSVASLGGTGALAGVQAGCEELESGKYSQYDNVVWIVPDTGNVARLGNQMYCQETGQHAIVASASIGSLLGQLVAHELGHADGLTHEYANAAFEERGVKLLMNETIMNDISYEMLAEGDVSRMRLADAGELDDGVKYFSEPRPELPAPLGTVDIVAESTTIDFEAGTAEFVFELSEPMEQDASVEFYTESVTASAGEDYEENVQRIYFYAGQTEAAESITLHTDATRSVEEVFKVGIRYGDVVGVSENSELEITLAVNESNSGGSDGDAGGSSGGGSSGPAIMLAMGLLGLFQMRKVRKHKK